MTLEHGTSSSGVATGSGGRSSPAEVVSRAGEEAGNVVGSASEGVREVADEAKAQVKAVAGQARQQFDSFVGQVRDEVGEQAQQRNDEAAGRLRALSEQLTALAQGRPEGAGSLTGLVYDAEDKVRALATRLEQRGPHGVAEDLSGWARRRPGLFLAAAAGVGFVVGRAVRAAASHDEAPDSAEVSARPAPSLRTGTPVGDTASLPSGDGKTAMTSGIGR